MHWTIVRQGDLLMIGRGGAVKVIHPPSIAAILHRQSINEPITRQKSLPNLILIPPPHPIIPASLPTNHHSPSFTTIHHQSYQSGNQSRNAKGSSSLIALAGGPGGSVGCGINEGTTPIPPTLPPIPPIVFMLAISIIFPGC